MISKKLLGITAMGLLTLSLTSNATQPVEADVATSQAAAANTNMFDPNNWVAGANISIPPAISTKLEFNAAHPSAWMKLVNPKSHMQTHKMFANPASYTQFMHPRFYMEFINPQNMMAWVNPASYQVMMEQQTMNYWMNPASYAHMIDPAMYQETLNPANYMVYLNPNTYLGLMGSGTCDPENPNKTPGWFGSTC